MATPAAVLSVLVTANTSQATRGIMRFNTQLGATETAGNKALGAVKTLAKGAAIGTGVGLGFAIKKAADFESQLDSLGAVSDATGRQMERFRKQAMKAGADTKFSALEAAEAQTELAKGGLSVAQIMRGGLRASLALAAAGEMDLAEAAGATVNAIKLFGLQGKDAMKVADGLATAANQTTADVSHFALALKQGGSAAKAAGLDFTETVSALEALAEMGIRGSDAGTSLKAALTQLAAPSEKSLALMDKLGLSFFDAEGNMKPLTEVSAMLRRRLGDLTREQRLAAATTLVGTDGMRALLALYDAGPQKIEKFQQGLSKQGTAADVAARKQDNLKGKLENLQGSIETIAIAIGMKMLPALTRAAEQITNILNDRRLSAGEKFNRLAQMLAQGFSDAIPIIADAAASAAPRVVEAFVVGWANASAWGKIAIAGFLIAKLGGGKAFMAAGRQIGAMLGIGITQGVAAGVGTGAAAGVGGAAAGGIAAGGLLGKLRGVFSGARGAALGKVGAIGLGVALADQLMQGFANRAQTGSPEWSKALEGLTNQPTLGAGGIEALFGESDATKRAKDVRNALEGIANQSKAISPNRARELRAAIGTLKGVSAEARDEMTQLVEVGVRQGHKIAMIRNEFGRMRQGSVLSIRELRQVTQTNFRAIAETMGVNSKAGREALQTNFRLGLRTIRDFRERGVLTTREAGREISKLLRVHSGAGKESLKRNYKEARDFIAATMRNSKGITREGMSAIRQIFAKELQLYGLSKEAIKFRLEGKEQSGKTIGAPLVGKQRGGPIDTGKPSGDSVPAVLERGEYVLNRKAVRKVGRKALDMVNFGAAPRFQGGGWVGDDPSGLNSAVKSMSLWAMRKYGASASDTSRAPGTLTSSGNVSDHTTGAAVDLVSPNMLAMAKGLVQAFQPRLKQLIHTPLGYSINYGQKVAPFAQEDHYDHVHIAALGKAVAAAMMRAPKIARQVVKGGADSPLKAVAQNVLDKVRGGALKRLRDVAQVNTTQADVGGPSTSGFDGGGTPAKNRALGLQMAKARGWGGANWRALDYLWGVGESAWDHTADNPTSSAYGIAQRLLDAHPLQPGEKYMTSPAAQIEWGLDYIQNRYGSPLKALAFWRSQNPHWYQKGGLVGLVGDSLGRGILDYGGFRGKLGKIDLAARAKGGEPSKWGVDQLRQIISPKMDAAVFDMGTNDGTAGNLGPSINAVQGMLGKRPLLMPTIVGGATDAANKNKLIRQKADEVIPWAANAGKYLTDGIHPFANGGQGVRATMIAQAVKQVVKADKKKPGKKQGRPRKAKKFPGGGPPKWAEIGAAVRVLQNSPDKDKRSKALRNVLDHIHAVGLPQGIDTKVDDFTEQASVAAEMVNRASQLTVETADGEVIPGIVGGKTETDWLHAQLEALFKLRNQLVQAENIVRERRERIAELLEKAQRRLDEIADEIRYAAQVRKQIQGDLDKAKKHPKKNKRLIGNLKHLLGRIDQDQDGRSRARKGLDRVIGALGGKRENLATSHSDLLTSVNDVQGTGSPLTVMSSLPEVGVLGGQIFDVQMRLRELAAPRETISDLSGSETGESESATLLQELLREANLRTAVSQKQYEVFKGMPPYGGEFATGGLVPGPIGEARTIVAHGGETVVPPGGSGDVNVSLVFAPGTEWLRDFVRVEVDKTTRRESRIAGRGLPGGRG